MSKYDWLLFLHLLGAFILLTTVFAAHAFHIAAVRRRRPSDVARFGRASLISARLIGVGAALAVGFGIWLVSFLAYGFGEAWIVASLVLFVIGAVTGPLFGQSLAPAGELAGRLSREDNQPSRELDRLLTRPRTLLFGTLSALAPLTILALMVFKPGAG